MINALINTQPYVAICNFAKQSCKILKVALYIMAITSAEGKSALPQNIKGTFCPIVPNFIMLPSVPKEVCPRTVPYPFIERQIPEMKLTLRIYSCGIEETKESLSTYAREALVDEIAILLMEKSKAKTESFYLPIEEVISKVNNKLYKTQLPIKLVEKSILNPNEIHSWLYNELLPSLLEIYKGLDLEMHLPKKLSQQEALKMAKHFESQISSLYGKELQEIFSEKEPEILFAEGRSHARLLKLDEIEFLESHFDDTELNFIKSNLDCILFSYIYLKDVDALKLIIKTKRGYGATEFFRRYQPIQEPQPGDLIIYYDAKEVKHHHAIYLGGNRALSKWGKKTIYEHDLFDVPAIYGNNVIFYRKNF